MNRRSFMSTILALGTVPAIVQAESLRRVFDVEIPIVYGTSRTCQGPIIGIKRVWADGKLIYPSVKTKGTT